MEDVMMRCKVDEENKIMVNKCNGINPIKKLGEVESSKTEMTGVREENIRLKTMLQKIEKDYKTLKMKFMEESNKSSSAILTTNGSSENNSDEDQEQELVSLRLGTITYESKRNDVIFVTSSNSNSSKSTASENDNNELKLGLDYNNVEGLKGDDEKKYPRMKENDLEGVKLPPGKMVKTQRSGDEENTQTSMKRARVCVRAKCDTLTMNDGCQWRKYGQKIAKGNPCPRAYYRCTVSPSCPVRKQVQRCVEDMSILITTYEGTHNHPLSVSATAMASTTSAAASMLLSGSSTSATNLYTPPLQSSTRINPYYYQNSSSTPFSTITLDLTTPNPTTTSTNFSLYSSNLRSTPMAQGTSLSFGSMDSNMIPFSYGTSSLQNNNHQSLDFGNQPKQQNYQSNLDNFINQGSSQRDLTETLTKIITSDPSFRSVIAAAISSMAAANGGTEQ